MINIHLKHLWLMEPKDGRPVLWVAFHRRENDHLFYEEYHWDDSLPEGFMGRALEAIENLISSEEAHK